MWRTPMMTQSVGVPLMAKRRSSTARMRSGSLSESECETPDWSNSGATTQTSSDSARAISAQTSRPGALMPSSLVTRMRIDSIALLDHRDAAHVGLERVRHRDRAVALLIGLHHGDERAADRDARAVERVHGANAAVLATVTRVHAARLEIAAHRAGRDLAKEVLPRQPDLDVVGLLRRETHVAGAQRDDAVVQIQPAQHLLGARQHTLMLVLALLGRRDRNELDLGELVLADHAARVLAGGTGLGAEARRERREAHRQFGLVGDCLTHQVGQGHLGGGDEPETLVSQLSEASEICHLRRDLISPGNLVLIRRRQKLALEGPELVGFELRQLRR